MLQGNVFQISQQASESLAKKYGTPLLVLSLEEVKRNYNILKNICRESRCFMQLRLIRILPF